MTMDEIDSVCSMKRIPEVYGPVSRAGGATIRLCLAQHNQGLFEEPESSVNSASISSMVVKICTVPALIVVPVGHYLLGVFCIFVGHLGTDTIFAVEQSILLLR